MATDRAGARHQSLDGARHQNWRRVKEIERIKSQSMALPNFYPFPVHSDEQSSGVRWRKYIDKFENLLCALDVHDDARKKALLLHYIGDEAYDIFDSFSDEQKGVGSVNAEGEANEYETLKHSFTTCFTPKQNSTYEIYKFRQAKQTQGETIDEFHTRLRTLANTCDFHDVKQEILMQILHGCLSSRLRRRGLMTNLPLDQLLAEARSYELAECRAAEIEGVTVGVNKVTQFRRGRGRYRCSSNRGSSRHGPTSRDQFDRGGSRGHYYSRGRVGFSTAEVVLVLVFLYRKSSNWGGFSQHGATNTCRYCGGPFPHLTPCPAKGKQCRSCQKIGHFARVCESTNHEVRQVMQGTESYFSDGEDNVQFVFAVNNSVTKTPTVETRICDTNISFLIDTGASINIIDYQSYQIFCPRSKLQPHSPMIYAYGSQSALPVTGNFSTQIIHKNANTARFKTKVSSAPVPGLLIVQ